MFQGHCSRKKISSICCNLDPHVSTHIWKSQRAVARRPHSAGISHNRCDGIKGGAGVRLQSGLQIFNSYQLMLRSVEFDFIFFGCQTSAVLQVWKDADSWLACFGLAAYTPGFADMIVFCSTSQPHLSSSLSHALKQFVSVWCTPLLRVFNFVHLLFTFVAVRLWLLYLFWFHDAATAKYSSGDITAETVEGVESIKGPCSNLNRGLWFAVGPLIYPRVRKLYFPYSKANRHLQQTPSNFCRS